MTQTGGPGVFTSGSLYLYACVAVSFTEARVLADMSMLLAPRPACSASHCAQELGASEKDLHASLVVTVLAKFLYLFAASMCMGLSFGLGTSFLMKRFKSNSVPQVLLLSAFA